MDGNRAIISLPPKTLRLITFWEMTIRYDNFTDQFQKFGAHFVLLIFADANISGGKRFPQVEI